jgi:hypothetical protein
MLTSWWQQAQVTRPNITRKRSQSCQSREAAIAATHNSR